MDLHVQQGNVKLLGILLQESIIITAGYVETFPITGIIALQNITVRHIELKSLAKITLPLIRIKLTFSILRTKYQY